MSSIVFTSSSYVAVNSAAGYSVRAYDQPDLKGYVISTEGFMRPVKCLFEYHDPAYNITLPPPSIKTRITEFETEYGKFHHYNDCHHWGIEPTFVGHVSLIDGVIEQVDDQFVSVPVVPYVFLHDVFPWSGYLSFGFLHSGVYLVSLNFGTPEYLTCNRVIVNSTYTGSTGPAGSVLYPRVAVTAVMTHMNGNVYSVGTFANAEARPDNLYIDVGGQMTPVSQEAVVRLLGQTYLYGMKLERTEYGSADADHYRVLTRWVEALDLGKLESSLIAASVSLYPEDSLAVEAYKSFRVKDATLLRELMDTMGDFAGLAKLSASAVPGLESIQDALHATNLREFFKASAGAYLGGKFGVEMPIKTLRSWSDVYTSRFAEKLEKQLFPTALRAQKSRYVNNGTPSYGLSGEGSFTMTLGLSTYGDWRDYVNAFYRWGLLLSASDGWELVPLSFVVDWLWSGVSALASAITSLADSYRLSVRYACRSSKLDLEWRVLGPRDPILGSSPLTIPVHYYDRSYSRKLPSLHLFATIQQESSAGTLNISSLPSALALLITFLT